MKNKSLITFALSLFFGASLIAQEVENRELDVKLTFKMTDKSPAAGLPVQVYMCKPRSNVPVKTYFDGKTDKNGQVHFHGDYPVNINTWLSINDHNFFSLIMPEEDLKGDKIHVTYLMGSRKHLGVGDPAPDFTVLDLKTNKDVSLSAFEGKVIILEFWASWCGPCQPAMTKLDELVGKRKDWAGKVVTIAVSCDDTVQEIRDHLSGGEWKNVQHVWCKEALMDCDAGMWYSKIALQYWVYGVPELFIIGKDGKVAASSAGPPFGVGHPKKIDIEKTVDALLKK